jgi:LPXTG-motif cell wall-anchored protein
VIAVAAASGAMAVTMPAFADSAANGVAAGSPGVISGNAVQVPVHIPVNLCGNTVNVIGALNPAFGNSCANKGGATAGEKSGGGAEASGIATDSPGVVSGNGAQVPVDVPVNATGNSVDVVGVLNPAFGNQAVNDSEEPESPSEHKPVPPAEPAPPTASRPEPKPMPAAPAPQAPAPSRAVTAPAPAPETMSALADTGADDMLPALAGSAALVLGGAVLYRRFRAGAQG